MTDQELSDYYTQLLIMEYATLPNAQGTIETFVTPVIANQIVDQVQEGFNFTVTPIGLQADSPVGVQLNAVGSYRGVQRTYFGLPDISLFEFADASNLQDSNGFLDAPEDPNLITWYFLTAEGTQVPIYSLSDDLMYRLTQFRAQVQSMFFSIENIDNLLEDFFGLNAAMFDNEDMTMLYIDLISDPDQLFTVAAVSNSLPRPAGVAMQVIRADMYTDFFGFQDAETAIDPSFVGFTDINVGFTTGTFISAP